MVGSEFSNMVNHYSSDDHKSPLSLRERVGVRGSS